MPGLGIGYYQAGALRIDKELARLAEVFLAHFDDVNDHGIRSGVEILDDGLGDVFDESPFLFNSPAGDGFYGYERHNYFSSSVFL
jgi:hypothetical protein